MRLKIIENSYTYSAKGEEINMDQKSMFRLSYGVFVLATRDGDRQNACITNTCMQVANSPTRVAISVINGNYTCDLLKKSGIFTLSMLDQTATFETIKHFGFQSGRNTDKMTGLTFATDSLGLPYVAWQTCAVLSCKIVDHKDLGSHSLFIAEVVDGKVLNENEPLTYADYQNHVKPKPEKPLENKKIVAWKCKICGYVYEGSELPKDFACPLCGHPVEDFEPVYEA